MSVELSIDAGVAELRLNRPDKLNAITDAMAAQLMAHLDAAESGGVRALMLRGEGRAFSAGRDLSDVDPLTEDAREVLDRTFNPLILRVSRLAVPTFAAVQGACLGVGLGLALACDVVYVADDARLGSPFARIGAVLDSGGHAFFVERLGAHRALELIYTGRLLSGAEAAAWGLINASVPSAELTDRVRSLARSVAQGPTAAFGESKRLVRDILDHRRGLEEVLAAEAMAQGAASRTRDYVEGIRAFQDKRPPRFVGS